MIHSAGLTRRGLLRAAFLTAGASLLAACSTPTSPVTNAPAAAPTAPQPAQQAPAAATGGPVEVTFITTQTNDADVKIYNQLADKFHQANPNITVKISSTDGTNYDQKLLTYIQAGTLPDI